MLGWVWEEGVDADRVDILLAVAAVLLGVAINYLFHQFLYLPRPGEMGIGNILLKHQFTARFPSNHGTGTLAVAIIFLFNKRWRGVGLLLTAVGLLTCWARVYLGVHLPFDMLGAALVALLCTILVRPAAARFARLVGARLSPAWRAAARTLTGLVAMAGDGRRFRSGSPACVAAQSARPLPSALPTISARSADSPALAATVSAPPASCRGRPAQTPPAFECPRHARDLRIDRIQRNDLLGPEGVACRV